MGTDNSSRHTLSLPENHSLLLQGLVSSGHADSKSDALYRILAEFYDDPEIRFRAVLSAYHNEDISLSTALELLDTADAREQLRTHGTSLRLGPQTSEDLLEEIAAAHSLGVEDGPHDDLSTDDLNLDTNS